MNRYKPIGWVREPYRHSLSARGIKTKIDLNRYKGKWYEIASIPQWFSKGCIKTTATYKKSGNKIDVINRCRKEGISDEAIGEARSVSDDNRKLKVSFFPFIEGDYNIEYVDKGYNNAVVGSGKKSLWILSRNKKIDMPTFRRLVRIAKNKGYNVSKLKETEQ